eukprot:18796-Pleurochrysis_carterae.AAC.2
MQPERLPFVSCRTLSLESASVCVTRRITARCTFARIPQALASLAGLFLGGVIIIYPAVSCAARAPLADAQGTVEGKERKTAWDKWNREQAGDARERIFKSRIG